MAGIASSPRDEWSLKPCPSLAAIDAALAATAQDNRRTAASRKKAVHAALVAESPATQQQLRESDTDGRFTWIAQLLEASGGLGTTPWQQTLATLREDNYASPSMPRPAFIDRCLQGHQPRPADKPAVPRGRTRSTASDRRFKTALDTFRNTLDHDGVSRLLHADEQTVRAWIAKSLPRDATVTQAAIDNGLRSLRVVELRDWARRRLEGINGDGTFDPTETIWDTAVRHDPIANRTRGGSFGGRVRRVWAMRCASCGDQPQSVLREAHIIPHQHNGSSDVTNGICLRADIDRLYECAQDAPLLTIDPSSMTWRVHACLASTWYASLEDRSVSLPRPLSPGSLDYHYQRFLETTDCVTPSRVTPTICACFGKLPRTVTTRAHIVPRSLGGEDVPGNLLTLRCDIDLLFEAANHRLPAVSIDPARWRWVVSDGLRDDPTYGKVHDQALDPDLASVLAADPQWITYHHRHFIARTAMAGVMPGKTPRRYTR